MDILVDVEEPGGALGSDGLLVGCHGAATADGGGQRGRGGREREEVVTVYYDLIVFCLGGVDDCDLGCVFLELGNFNGEAGFVNLSGLLGGDIALGDGVVEQSRLGVVFVHLAHVLHYPAAARRVLTIADYVGLVVAVADENVLHARHVALQLYGVVFGEFGQCVPHLL